MTNHRRVQRAKAGLAVPLELVEKDRWVRRFGKRPVTASGKAASVTDPRTWDSLAAVQRSKVGSGLGFVLGEGIGCIDLDDALDANGILTAEAKAVLDLAPDTWVQVSPSGRGLHVWGLLPAAPGRVLSVGGQSVEVYSRDRYMTITGDRFEDAPLRLAALSDFVDVLI